jgi:hypothetical protein
MITNLGKVDKLYIEAYKDAAYQDKAGERFTALINPESYSYKYKAEYCETQGPGSTAVSLKFSKMPPQEINFDFLFDGTGVVKKASVINIAIPNPFDESDDVSKQIEDFKSKILAYQSGLHRPHFLQIHWGALLFKCILTSMDIEYKLFNPGGTPLRAVAKCSFRESIDDGLRIAIEHPESPDVTHERTFKSSDKLSLMAADIYSDQSFYIDVAKANRLDSFRNIKAGTILYFLPIEK